MNSKRDFNIWFSTFKNSIADYKYYVDFEKVYREVQKVRIELNILNSLIGSNNIEKDFENIIKQYPKTLNCLPILIAKREKEIHAIDEDGAFNYNFKIMNYSIEQYKVFMRKTGLFDLLSQHIVNNLVDYVLGVEAGLNTNGRKNRGGHLMEDLVERFLKKENIIYFKEMYVHDIEKKWNIDLSVITNSGKTRKRFDFVVQTENCIYAIEANFYSGGGSKLNETARSYKMISTESKDIPGFVFVWFTDGIGWTSARHNLEETFDVLDTMFNINDLENGILNKLLK